MARLRGPWKPYLGEQGRRSALLAAEAIADELSRELGEALPEPPRDRTAAHVWHLSTAALFLAYFEQVTGRSARVGAGDLLGTAIEVLETTEDAPARLYGGVAGLGWCIHHVGRLTGSHDPRATAVVGEELLDLLEASSSACPAFDLMGGLVGLGLYALEAKDNRLAERVVDLLDERVEELPGEALTWRTPPEVGGGGAFPRGHYNLGLAHGVAGVVAFLALAAARGIATERSDRLVDGAARWLLGQRLAEGERRVLPWAVARDAPPLSWGHDPGWAYAEAGIAATLLSVAQRTGDLDLHAFALMLAQHEMATFAEARDRNPGIGYGPAGFAQVFGRLAQRTGAPELRRAARSAVERLLAMRAPEAGASGFFVVDRSGRRRPAGPDFLSGTSGIGLVLLAAAAAIDPAWDRLLLLSPADPPSRPGPSSRPAPP